MISGQQVFFFFSSNLVGRIFFSLLYALQDIFFSPRFSARFFFPQKSVVFKLLIHYFLYNFTKEEFI